MQDMMLSGPPRLLGYVYYNKLVVQDPIQKYNYRPDHLPKYKYAIFIRCFIMICNIFPEFY